MAPVSVPVLKLPVFCSKIFGDLMRVPALLISSVLLAACGTDWEGKYDCPPEFVVNGVCSELVCADGTMDNDWDCDDDGLLVTEDCDDNNPDPGVCDDDDGDGFREVDGDCDDGNAAVSPSGTEVCDGFDNDCDGATDENVKIEYFLDADEDRYGDPTTMLEDCAPPAGYVSNPDDCDDADASSYPRAPELCDDVDNDCDGFVDNDAEDSQEWFLDADSDGFGGTGVSIFDCDEPDGYVSNDTDCDDGDPSINPYATEVCDDFDVDENCNGFSDDDDAELDLSSTTTWWIDLDSDGYGHVSSTVETCDAPSGYVQNFTDCDDSDAGVNPSAREVCDGAGTDENCDGYADETRTWYADSDGDSYGDAGVTLDDCDTPTGYVADDTDCDDTEATTNPGATEYCDSVDNDCDGTTDESDAADAVEWWGDNDSDGYGDTSSSTTSCSQPSGYVSNDDDCDDADAAISPDATEICDSADVDEDCNGLADDADSGVDTSTQTTFYADSDSDGYGDLSSTSDACDEPSGYVSDNSDCDDGNGSINPAATEVCDSADVDEDCDGLSDDADSSVDTSTHNTFYADSDSDGYGDLSSTSGACDEPSGYVTDHSDCDDGNAAINPAATEVCDSADVDEDCDGLSDDADSSVDSTTYNPFFADSDGDGYGGGSVTYTCDQPSGYSDNSADCNDADSSINPAATEICDAADTDEDCNGFIDDNDAGVDTSSYNTFYTDADFDGYGDVGTPVLACDASLYYVADATDCDDADVAVNPAATEVCDSADVDEDCDGLSDDADSSVDTSTYNTFYADTDGDGYGDATSSATACDELSGYVEDNSDCDDADASTGSGNWYPDQDEDGYGDDSASVTSTCTDPSDSGGCTDGDTSTLCYVAADNTDCDDSEFTVNPDEVEASYDLATDTVTNNCTDALDNDCNGDVDTDDVACDDLDGDGLEDGIQVLFASDVNSDGDDDGLVFGPAFEDAGSAWVGSDCITTNSFPWTSITLSSARAPVSASWGGRTYALGCLMPRTSGYAIQKAYSDVGSDGSSAVDPTDTTDWIDVGLQTYCGNANAGGLSDFCANHSTYGWYTESTYDSSTGLIYAGP